MVEVGRKMARWHHGFRHRAVLWAGGVSGQEVRDGVSALLVRPHPRPRLGYARSAGVGNVPEAYRILKERYEPRVAGTKRAVLKRVVSVEWRAFRRE